MIPLFKIKIKTDLFGKELKKSVKIKFKIKMLPFLLYT